MTTLIPDAFPKAPQKPVNGKIVDDDSTNISSNSYKKVLPKKPYIYTCTCSLCGCVGSSWIIQQYIDFEDILIEDRSTRIFDLFTEKEVK